MSAYEDFARAQLRYHNIFTAWDPTMELGLGLMDPLTFDEDEVDEEVTSDMDDDEIIEKRQNRCVCNLYAVV